MALGKIIKAVKSVATGAPKGFQIPKVREAALAARKAKSGAGAVSPAAAVKARDAQSRISVGKGGISGAIKTARKNGVEGKKTTRRAIAVGVGLYGAGAAGIYAATKGKKSSSGQSSESMADRMARTSAEKHEAAAASARDERSAQRHRDAAQAARARIEARAGRDAKK